MSAPLGGAAFEISATRDQFRADLAAAEQDARQAAGAIQQILSGSGAPRLGGGTAAGTGAQQAAAQAQVTAQSASQVAAETAAAAQSAQGLAQGMQAVSAATGQAAIDAAQLAKRAEEAFKATQALRQAEARLVPTDQPELSGIEGIRDALAALSQGNATQALADIQAAAQLAEASLEDVREAIAAIAVERAAGGGEGGVSAAQVDELQTLQNELGDLRARGIDTAIPAFAAMRQRVDELTLAIQDESDPVQKLVGEYRNLTQVVGQLHAAERQLTTDQREATAVAGKLAEKQRDAASARQATQASAQARAVAVQPGILGEILPKDIIEGLKDFELTTAQATKAVNGLYEALGRLTKARGVEGSAVGLAQMAEATDRVDTALANLTTGNRASGLRRIDQALESVEQALLQARRQTEALTEATRQLGDEESRAALKAAQAAQAHLKSTQSALQSAKAAVSAPETAVEKAAASEAANATKNAAAKAAAQARQRMSTALSALQDISYATGLGPLGEGIAGITRAAQAAAPALESMGLSLGAATAAAAGLAAAVLAIVAAIGATVVVGLEFNSFLEQSQIRMEAATGSAADAQAAMDNLLDSMGSRDFGIFPVEDLEAGLALMDRLGLSAEENQRRIADVAAATGKTFAETVTQVGSITDLLSSGQAIGDQLRSLQKAGILTGDYVKQLLAARAAGLSVADQLAIFNEALDRFEGTSAKMGNTAAGSWTRLKNEFKELAGEATGGAFAVVGPTLGKIADILGSDKMREGVHLYGQFVGYIVALGAVTLNPLLVALKSVIDLAGHLPGFGDDQAPEEPKPPVKQGPTSETVFEGAKTAYDAGVAAVNAYVTGFDEASATEFDKIHDTVQKAMEGALGGALDPAGQLQLASAFDPMIARLVEEMQRTGQISETTANEARTALGSQYDAVIKLVEGYQDLREATAAVAQAKINASVTRDTREGILNIDQGVIDEARRTAKQHAGDAADAVDKIRDQITGLQGIARLVDQTYASTIKKIKADIEGMQKANEKAAEAARVEIQRQQDSLKDYQDKIAERRRQVADDIRDYQDAIATRREGAQADLDALQEKLDALNDDLAKAREAASQHQAAFNAVIAGTVDLYNQVETQQDEITRKIIAKWEAEIGGLRRARAEAEQQVGEDEQRILELQLAYDRRIAAARAGGRPGEAAALAAERDRVLARERERGQVARDEAELARRAEQQAIEEARQAAAQQGATDQAGLAPKEAAVSAAQQAVKDAQEAEAARQKAEDKTLAGMQRVEEQKQRDEDDEVKRRQDEIDHLQRVEADRARVAAQAIKDRQDDLKGVEDQRKAAADYWDEQIRQRELEIKRIEDQQKKQAKADQAAIDDAQRIYDADKTFWDARVKADDAALLTAQQTLDAVTSQLNAQIALNSQLAERNRLENEYLNILREAVGIAKEIQRTNEANPALGQPGYTESGPGGPGGAAPALPPIYPYALGMKVQPGYHVETDKTNHFWQVKDGYNLKMYGIEPLGASGGGPTSAFRAADGGGGQQYLRTTVGSGGGGTGVVLPGTQGGGGGGGWAGFTGPVVNIENVNASDPRDVELLLDRVTDAVFGSGLGALDTTRRGGVTRGRDQVRA